ncbi:hypothetical protein DAPPUDRAFT_241168 [Daphnia pulex]|uniref:Uncharacterized protein n=1 Tax=Daphnia pulex TaxID=6669 RepID=E9GDK9_DAPPU|nr:hypothetical protein DAPPUDRAFT_241168 [Daphnia pulex]|eukprot:EFX82100.1 hypothetical protein DAPPUDRAFT_241168 [Daphnia pulex]
MEPGSNLELPSKNDVGMTSLNPTIMMPPYLMPPPHMLPPPTIMRPLCTIPPPHMMKHPPPLYVGRYGLPPTFQGNGLVGMPMLHSRNNYHQ